MFVLNRKFLLLGCAVGIMAAPEIVSAQPSDSTASGNASDAQSGQAGIADIVVTASKRSQDQQKAPAAISVVGGESIATVGVTDATFLSKLVPSLVIGKQGSNAVVFLRGVGQTNSNPLAQPAVSTNLDGVYMPRELSATAIFDLERVEVLPGPQGTLYGRNSAGGAVNFVTKKPGPEFAADGYLEYGNYNAIHGSAGVTVPLNEALSVRAAIDYNNHDGYLSNGGNDADAFAGRVMVSLKPSADLQTLVQYTHIREDGVGPQNLARGTANPPFGSPDDPWFDSFPNDDLYQRIRGDMLTANVSLQLGDINLTYLPGYMHFNSLNGFQFNGAVYGTFTQSVTQYSQELRLASTGTGPLKWLAGLYWYKAKVGLTADIGLPAFVFVRFGNRLKSYAGFGEATYSLSDTFRITAGGRYSYDRFDGDGSQSPPLSVFGARDSANTFDWKIGAELDVAPRSMLYATAQSGYLQGGYTQADSNSNLPKTFKPVRLISLTGGIKNRFLDNRLQINNEVFYYSYKNYQLQTVIQDNITQIATFIIVNVPKATIYGDQLDMVYAAGPNTDLNLSFAYLHAKVKKGLPTAPTYEGFDLPNAPKVTINAAIEQRFPLGNGGNIAARVASTFNSGYWTVFTHDSFSHQGSFTKTDANLTYNSPGGRWSIGAYVRNIENTAAYYGSNGGAGPGSFSPTFIDAPRTYGVRGTFKF